MFVSVLFLLFANAASMVLNIASYHIAYIVCLLAALAITTATGHSNLVIMFVSVLFLLFAVGLVVAVIAISAGHVKKQAALVERVPVVRHAMQFLTDADAKLTQNLRLITETSLWQVVIFLLDAATMWVLILALGNHATIKGVYASFMISSLLRTMGIVPGGLGFWRPVSRFGAMAAWTGAGTVTVAGWTPGAPERSTRKV